MNTIKRIPYGLTDFNLIRKENYYYVDKTRFIPLLEETSRHLFFIRPRRFGKSLFLSIIEAYYDIDREMSMMIFRKNTVLSEVKLKVA